ncbi:probable serine/threonine-protein kinase PLK [Rhagoletis pomonella]|uniref:probable serine/threonine-protein kinase PLK n=1 Tax=Rhagoletis pomonella TaxID=28610 RepID=UPI00177E8775|nr:probable serine/threonine-protein kinase PLK [Rhagoletis pomonella]
MPCVCAQKVDRNQAKNKRNKYHKLYKANTANAVLRDQYMNYVNQFNVLDKFLYNRYIGKLEAELKVNPKAFWNFIRSKRGSSNIPAFEFFAEFFKSNFYSEADNPNNSNARSKLSERIDFGSLTSTELDVSTSMSTLKPSLKCDSDGLCAYFAFLTCVAVFGFLGSASAEFNYNPNLYTNNNNDVGTNNIKSYSDNDQQPANSYNVPLKALNGFRNNAPTQQQQLPVNGYNYNPNSVQQLLLNNYNNNASQQLQWQQQQQQPTQQPQRNDNSYSSGTRTQSNNGVPAPAGYDYTPKNYEALSSSSSSSGSVLTTSTNIDTSFSSNAQQRLAPEVVPVEEYNPPAKYDYRYNVHDEYTGDIKSHNEARDGYFIQGSYSVVDPDGFQRTVSYTVDGPSGFNAVVNRVPFALKPIVSAVALSAPSSSAAPISKISELPLTDSVLLQQSSAASGSSTSVSEKERVDDSDSDSPVEPRDSYGSPPADTRDGKGPYP